MKEEKIICVSSYDIFYYVLQNNAKCIRSQSTSNGKARAICIDRIARFTFPISFFLFTIIYWVIYNYFVNVNELMTS